MSSKLDQTFNAVLAEVMDMQKDFLTPGNQENAIEVATKTVMVALMPVVHEKVRARYES